MTILYCRLYGYILRVVGGMVLCILLQWSAWIVLGGSWWIVPGCRIVFRDPLRIVLGSGWIVSRSLDRVGWIGSGRSGGSGRRVSRIVSRLPDQVGRIVPGLRAAWIVPGSCSYGPSGLLFACLDQGGGPVKK